MKKLVFLSVLLASLQASAAIAAPVTIDFEEYPGTTTGPAESKGFFILGQSGNIVTDTDSHFMLTNHYIWQSGNLTIEHDNGLGFSAQSLTLAGLHTSIVGYTLDGATVTGGYSTVSNGGFNEAIVTFDSSWTNLDRIEVGAFFDPGGGGGGAAIDNIVVNVVPIPAAAWLFGSALLGMGWFRRAP